MLWLRGRGFSFMNSRIPDLQITTEDTGEVRETDPSHLFLKVSPYWVSKNGKRFSNFITILIPTKFPPHQVLDTVSALKIGGLPSRQE